MFLGEALFESGSPKYCSGRTSNTSKGSRRSCQSNLGEALKRFRKKLSDASWRISPTFIVKALYRFWERHINISEWSTPTLLGDALKRFWQKFFIASKLREAPQCFLEMFWENLSNASRRTVSTFLKEARQRFYVEEPLQCFWKECLVASGRSCPYLVRESLQRFSPMAQEKPPNAPRRIYSGRCYRKHLGECIKRFRQKLSNTSGRSCITLVE